ncbi:MAG: Com family DNA-binding transcriptional regulator [Syntrophomonas sp.]
MNDFRCKKCQKLLGKYRECEQLEIKCPRCGTKNILKENEKVNMNFINNTYPLLESCQIDTAGRSL